MCRCTVFSPSSISSLKPLFFSELGFFHSPSLICRPPAQRSSTSHRTSILFACHIIHREIRSVLAIMANEMTSDAMNKVAARFSELYEWVKQPATQTVNAAANEEANAAPNEELNDVVNEKEPRSSMYPELHSLIAENLEEDGLEYTFRQNDQKVGIKRAYDTKVIGEFTCPKRKCRIHRWFSNSIAIRIREYEGHQYNVQVYHQRCSHCEQPTRAKLKELAYADRVAYYLKKWNGINAVPPTIEVDHKSNHMKELCEGCKKGHCGDKRDKKKKMY